MEAETIKELGIMLNNHIEHQKEKQDAFIEKLDKIEEQTKKTNGNVRKLFLWRSYILGGLSDITILVIPLLLYILKHR